LSSDLKALIVLYYENERYGKYNPNIFGTNFCFFMQLEPYKYTDQKEYSYYTWHIGRLVKDTTEDWAVVNYREPDMTKALEIAFKSVYGENLGQKVFNYGLNEFDKDINTWFDKGYEYNNLKTEYRSDLEGLEVSNDNGGYISQCVFFSTNKK
jgi:hypothetical protein